MLQLYNEKPVLISMKQNKSVFSVEFCNIKMKLKVCQFKLFNNYLINKSKTITSDTSQVELLLVKSNLTVTVSLSNFLQLMHGVKSVVQKEYNLKN